MSNLATSQTFAAYSILYSEGSSEPAFKGLTQISLESETQLRELVRQSLPNVRKAAFTILGAAQDSLPEFFRKAGGVFHFSKTQPVTPLQVLRHHVTGAVERGEAEPVVEIPAPSWQDEPPAPRTKKISARKRGKTQATRHSKKPTKSKKTSKVGVKARKSGKKRR